MVVFDKIIEILTAILDWLLALLERINASPIPEWTGIVLAKSVRFFVDTVAPLINEYIVVIFNR